MQRFAGKSAIVTGGASGIGAAICRRLATERAFVCIVDSNAAAAAALAEGGKADRSEVEPRMIQAGGGAIAKRASHWCVHAAATGDLDLYIGRTSWPPWPSTMPGRPEIRDLVEIATISEGPVTDLGGVSVSAKRVDHPPVTECYARRFEWAGKSAVFSADTCYFPPLGEFAAGADVLVHEAMLTAGVDKLVRRTPAAGRLREHLLASHTPAEDAGRVAFSAMVGTLVLNHLVPADDPDFGENDWQREVSKTWNGRLVIGRDGLTAPIGAPDHKTTEGKRT